MASKYLILRIDDDLRAAVDAHCAAHALEFSALIRRLLAREIGRPDLAAAMLPRGRPKKLAKPKSASRKAATSRKKTT